MPHVVSYVESRHKISVYRRGTWGELFDLESDPDEVRNLWNEEEAAGLRQEMLHRMVQGFLRSEPVTSPRVAHA
jgi:uncharacterized sulfatase